MKQNKWTMKGGHWRGLHDLCSDCCVQHTNMWSKKQMQIFTYRSLSIPL